MKGSGMPQIRSAMNGWARRITMSKIKQSVLNGLTVSTPITFSFRGTVQPLTPKEIMLKPEGQRAWEWVQIHVLSSDISILQPNDIIKYIDKTYKIMGQNDYSLNGYIEYHAVKDFQNGQP